MVSYITEYCVCPHVVVDIWHFHTIGLQGKKCSFVSHRKAERKKVGTTFNISTFVFFKVSYLLEQESNGQVAREIC